MKLILTGSLSIDQIMNFDGTFEEMIQPDKLHILSLSVLIKELCRTRGGIAGNLAYSLALLGEEPILLASIGQEQREYMADLAELNVDISHVHYSSLPTSTFSVITDRNDCQVGGFYPGAMGDWADLKLDHFDPSEAFLVISANDPQFMAKLIEDARRLKMRTFFDVGQQVIMLPPEVLRDGIAAAELLILNDYEMGVLCRRSGLSQAEVIRQVDVCVVTLGEKGSLVYDRRSDWQEQAVESVKVKSPVDPTGAGDAFRSGFLYGYVRGWKTVDCARLGSTVAAYAVEQRGTQEHRFDLAQLKKRYRQQYKLPLSMERKK